MIGRGVKGLPDRPEPRYRGKGGDGRDHPSAPRPAEREKWPESIYLQVNHTRLSYTIETPSSLPLDARVAALRAVLGKAIDLTIRAWR